MMIEDHGSFAKESKILAFAKNLQNLKRKKERNLKRCALFGFVLGWVEFYVDGWLALRVSHTPSSIPFITSDGGNEEFD
jgi:hypothetical protein